MTTAESRAMLFNSISNLKTEIVKLGSLEACKSAFSKDLQAALKGYSDKLDDLHKEAISFSLLFTEMYGAVNWSDDTSAHAYSGVKYGSLTLVWLLDVVFVKVRSYILDQDSFEYTAEDVIAMLPVEFVPVIETVTKLDQELVAFVRDCQ